MRKRSFRFLPSFLILVLTLACASAVAQTAIPSPLLVLQDASTDTATEPLLWVEGGTDASTQGIQVTSQTTGTGGPITLFQPMGYGGITLLQTGAATSTTGQDSPQLSICAQQWTGSGASTPQCWIWQVKGGGSSSGQPNQQDVLLLSRTPTNTTGNLTLQLPKALNIAAGDSTNGGQLTIGSVPSGSSDLSGVPITVVGAFTSNTSGIAGPLQLFPGFLNSTNALLSASVEGPLQIGMAVKGAGTKYELACYSASQTASPCTNTTSPLLGVYLTTFACTAGGTCSTGNSNAVITPPGRATVASAAVGGVYWGPGSAICRDPSTPADGVLAASGACAIGQAVGVAVGDATGTTPTSHAVDLDFSDQGVTTSGTTTTYATAATSLTTAPAGNLLASDGQGNISDSGVNDGFTAVPFVSQVVGIYNATSKTGNVTQTLYSNSGSYELIVYTSQSAAANCLTSNGSVGFKVSYTDATGTQLVNLFTLTLTTAGTGHNQASYSLFNTGTNNIQLQTTWTACGGGASDYDIHATLLKLQ